MQQQLAPVGSNWPTRKNPINGTPTFIYNPTSSDSSDWTVLSWNPVSCEPTNIDHFQTLDYPEWDRKWSDPEIGSGRFRLYGSDRNSTNPIIGYQRKTADHIGIRQQVIDRIRFSVSQRILCPSDRIRCTRFDLGGLKRNHATTETLNFWQTSKNFIWLHVTSIGS